MAKRSSQAPGAEAKAKGLAARGYAVAALHRILDGGVLLDEALAAVRASDLAPADKAFTHALVATALRRKGQIDDIVNRFLSKPLPKKSGRTREILLCGAAQMLFLDVPAHAAIDTAVRLSRGDAAARHFSGLVNAVLRRVGENGALMAAGQDPSINLPQWMRESWRKAYGEDVARQCAVASLDEAALDITVKADAERWAQVLSGAVLPMGSVRLAGQTGRVSDLPGFADGAWWVQDAAAAMPVRLLGDVSGLRILDLCAAPGGKTAQLAAGGAKVTAVDVSQSRLERVSDNLRRLKLSADIVCADAADYAGHGAFDAVVCDVPCSATGTLRRHPDGLHVKTAGMPKALGPLQRAILDNAIANVRPGGHVIYCACSLQPEECEGLVREVLSSRNDLIRQAVSPADVAGLSHLISGDGDLRTLPCHEIGAARGMDGFFAARLVKC